MTNQAFLRYFAGGLDIQGHRVTASLRRLEGHEAFQVGIHGSPVLLVLQVDHGAELPIPFQADESFDSRMAKVDEAVARWLVLRPPT